MARLLLLVIFFLWMAFGEVGGQAAIVAPWIGAILFFGGFAAIVLFMRVWGDRVAGRMTNRDDGRAAARFHLGLDIARTTVCVWYAAGVLALGWPQWVELVAGPFIRAGIHLPGLIVGAAPAMAAWSGLWWAQYSVDRAQRESELEARLGQRPLGPIARSQPSFAFYFQLQWRMQILMTVAPLLLVMAVHDLMAFAAHWMPAPKNPDELELIFSVVSVASVLVWGPEILRRVVKTRPLADGPLRRRLTTLAERCNIGYREILLWDTGNQIANAMVMGLHARLRYVMISDLLIETLTDQQIEAVFAHELGHVRHRHLLRLSLFAGLLLLVMAGPATTVRSLLTRAGLPDGWWIDAGQWIVCGAAFFAAFGFILRRFERQADLFAARTLLSRPVTVMAPVTALAPVHAPAAGSRLPLAALAAALFESPTGFPAGALSLADTGDMTEPGRVLFSESCLSVELSASAGVVTQNGAAIMCNALRRTAMINNLPVAARSWCHGSIAARIAFLNQTDRDARTIPEFDRAMIRLNAALLFVGITAAVWTGALLAMGN